MVYIENNAVEAARMSVERAKEEYNCSAGSDRKMALARYLEALRAYRTIVKVRYHI